MYVPLLMVQRDPPLSQNRLEFCVPTTAVEIYTNLYTVTILYHNVLNKIQEDVKQNSILSFFYLFQIYDFHFHAASLILSYLLFSNQLYHVFLCISGIILSSPFLTTYKKYKGTLILSNMKIYNLFICFYLECLKFPYVYPSDFCCMFLTPYPQKKIVSFTFTASSDIFSIFTYHWGFNKGSMMSLDRLK